MNHADNLSKSLDLATQEPVCLSTLTCSTESIDFFLQESNEPIVNYLRADTILKVVYCSKKEKEEEVQRLK